MNDSSSSDADDSMVYDEDEESTSSSEETTQRKETHEHLATAKELIVSCQMGYDSGLNAFVNKELWRVTKFMSPRDEYDPNCHLARFCYRSLRIADNQQALWWRNTWGRMKKILSKKRTSVTQRMMKAFQGKTRSFSVLITVLIRVACFNHHR